MEILFLGYNMSHLAVRSITSHLEHVLLADDDQGHCRWVHTQLWTSIFISELLLSYLLVRTQMAWGMNVDNINICFPRASVKSMFIYYFSGERRNWFCLHKAREPHIYWEYNPKISSGWLKMQIALKLTCKYYFFLSIYLSIYTIHIHTCVYIDTNEKVYFIN